MVEVARRVGNDPDGFPEATLLRANMTEWCEIRWGEAPSETTLKNWIRELYDRLTPAK